MSGLGYVPAALWSHPGLQAVDLAVYAALESFCSWENRSCWPSQDRLQLMVGLKRRGLRNSLQRLAAADAVRIERKSVGGLKRGNVYHLRCARNGPSADATPEDHSGTKRPIDVHETAHHSGTKRPLYSGTKRPLLNPTNVNPTKRTTPMLSTIAPELDELCDAIHAEYAKLLPGLKQSRRKTVIAGLRSNAKKLKPLLDDHSGMTHLECWRWLFQAIARDEHYRGDRDWHGANLAWLVAPRRGSLEKTVRRMEANEEHEPRRRPSRPARPRPQQPEETDDYKFKWFTDEQLVAAGLDPDDRPQEYRG